jgi:hypothetical protein
MKKTMDESRSLSGERRNYARTLAVSCLSVSIGASRPLIGTCQAVIFGRDIKDDLKEVTVPKEH